MQIATIAEKNDVVAKYETVHIVILPLSFALILADTVIKHERRSGNVNNFKTRRNSSPGYEINKMASSEKCTERKLVPINNERM